MRFRGSVTIPGFILIRTARARSEGKAKNESVGFVPAMFPLKETQSNLQTEGRRKGEGRKKKEKV